MGDGVYLVFPQGDLRVHAGEIDVTAVILTGAVGVEQDVIGFADGFTALRVLPDPLCEGFLDKLSLRRNTVLQTLLCMAAFPVLFLHAAFGRLLLFRRLLPGLLQIIRLPRFSAGDKILSRRLFVAFASGVEKAGD